MDARSTYLSKKDWYILKIRNHARAHTRLFPGHLPMVGLRRGRRRISLTARPRRMFLAPFSRRNHARAGQLPEKYARAMRNAWATGDARAGREYARKKISDVARMLIP